MAGVANGNGNAFKISFWVMTTVVTVGVGGLWADQNKEKSTDTAEHTSIRKEFAAADTEVRLELKRDLEKMDDKLDRIYRAVNRRNE